MLTGVADKANSWSTSGIYQQLNASWRGDVLPFCGTAIANRFPFSPESRQDASLDDVIKLFGPSGLIESFVKGPLAPYVDTTRTRWREAQNIGLSQGALDKLAYARQIGMSLFSSGGTPKMGFTLTPVTLDQGSANIALDLDGQELRYAHGPTHAYPFAWPGPGGTNIVRVSFAPMNGDQPITVSEEGTWSLFRLFHGSQMRTTEQPDVFELTFSGGGHSAKFTLHAGSVANPFDLRLMNGFSCPDHL
jgi:type VI secretion system protein ImpL